jgi:hypothetical protein
VSVVRQSDLVEVWQRTTTSNWINVDFLRAANYTATVSIRGCSYSFNFSIDSPPVPVVNDLVCSLLPVDQIISCTWVRQALETYTLEYAVAVANSTAVPDSDAFVEVRDNFVGRPFQFGYLPGRKYFIKLSASNLGGTTSSIIQLDATLARPARPRYVESVVQLGGVAISWTLPVFQVPDEVVYDVYLQNPNTLGPLVAVNVTGLSTFVSTTDLENSRFLAPGSIFGYVVLSRSLRSGLVSFFPGPGERQSAFQFYLRTPSPPQILSSFKNELQISGSYIGVCRTRCLMLLVPVLSSESGGAGPVDLVIDYRYTGGDDSQYVELWRGTVMDALIKLAVPRLPFGFYATFRASVTNAIGTASNYLEVIVAEPPFAPRLTTRRDAVGDIELTRVTLNCMDGALAAGVQASTFRYEYVLDDVSPDWSQATSSPEISGPFVADFPSNDTFLFARCVAINPFGEAYNILGDARVYLPPPFRTPSNLRMVLLGKNPSVDELSVRLEWDFSAQYLDVFTENLFDLKVYGEGCSSVARNLTVAGSLQTIIKTRARCTAGFAIRARNERGVTPWSGDIFQVFNYPPRAPYGVAFPRNLQNLQQTAVVTINATLLPIYYAIAADAVLGLEVQITTNFSDPSNDSNWSPLYSFTYDDVTRLRVDYGIYKGVAVPFNFSVNTQPTIVYIRSSTFNGMSSGWIIDEFLIVGDPVPPNVTTNLDFHPTNATVSFSWDFPVWVDVVFPYTCVFTPLVGQPSTVQGTVANGTTLAFYGLAAGTRVSLDILAATTWRRSSVSSASVTVASGTYWPQSSIDRLTPNVTRVSPLSARVSWKEDKTLHGFATTLYQILVSYGPISSYNVLADILEPVAVNGVVAYDFATTTYNDDVTFVIIPFNPLGSGPQSNASTKMDFRPSRRNWNLMQPRATSAAVSNGETTIYGIEFQPVTHATDYKMIVVNSLLSFETQEIGNISCCTAYFSASPFFTYQYSMFFFDPFYGWLPNAAVPSFTAWTPGLVKPIEIESLVVTANLTGAFVDAQFALPLSALSPSLNATEIFMVLRTSVSGFGVWEEQVAPARSCFERRHVNPSYSTYRQFLCSSRFWYSGPPTVSLDVQVAAAFLTGRTPWTATRTAALFAFPASVNATLDDTDSAVNTPRATNGTEIQLPLRWPHQRPFGLDVTSYHVRSFTFCYNGGRCDYPSAPDYYQGVAFTPQKLRCGLPGGSELCYPSPFHQQYISPSSQAQSVMEAWISVRVGSPQRVLIFAQTLAGLFVVSDQVFQPVPLLPIWNMRVESSARGFDALVSFNTILPLGSSRYLGWKLTIANAVDSRFPIVIAGLSNFNGEPYAPPRTTCVLDGNPGRPLQHICQSSFSLRPTVRPPLSGLMTLEAHPQTGSRVSSWISNAGPLPRQKQLVFPGLWNSLVLPGSDIIPTPNEVTRFECGYIPSYLGYALTLGFREGLNGTRPFLRQYYVQLEGDAVGYISSISITTRWRDGSIEDRVQELESSRFQSLLSQSPGTRQGWFYYVEEGGIVDVEATIVEQRTFAPDFRTPYPFTYVLKTECSLPSPPRIPLQVAASNVALENGMCRIPFSATVDGVTGSRNYTRIIVTPYLWRYYLRSPQSSEPVFSSQPLGRLDVPLSSVPYDPRTRTFSSSFTVPQDNYVVFFVSLVNDAGMESFPQRAINDPLWCGAARTVSFATTGSYASVQGNNGTQLVFSPPLPDWLEASPFMRLKIDNAIFTLPYNNPGKINFPPTAVGPHTISLRMDNWTWGPGVGFNTVALPTAPAVQIPLNFDARRPGAFAIFSSSGFNGLLSVNCFFSGRFSAAAVFSRDRSSVSCEIPVYPNQAPTKIFVTLSLDGTMTEPVADLIFWGSFSFCRHDCIQPRPLTCFLAQTPTLSSSLIFSLRRIILVFGSPLVARLWAPRYISVWVAFPTSLEPRKLRPISPARTTPSI